MEHGQHLITDRTLTIYKHTMNQLAEIVQTNELDPKDGQIIIDRFGGYEQVAQEWDAKAKSIVVTSREQTTEMAMAREARKKFTLMRLELEKARKTIGEPAFRKYKAVNAVAKYLQVLIQPIEDHLRLQEDFIKNDDARIEAEKKIEEERRVEAERIAKEAADRKEQERIRLENDKLKKEAEAREKAMEEERKKADAQRLALQEKARKEREALETKAHAQRVADQKKLDREREAREKIQKQLRDQKEKAAQQERDRLAAIKKQLEEDARIQAEALKAPDRDKALTYIQTLLNTPRPEVKDKSIQTAINNVIILLTDIREDIINN